MSCREFDENQILLFAYGELEPDAADRLKAHLAECEACRSVFEEIESTRLLVKDPSMPGSPSSVTVARLTKAAKKRMQKPGLLERLAVPRFYPVPRLAWALAAAVLLAVGISIFMVWQKGHEQSHAYDMETFDELIEELSEEGIAILAEHEESESSTREFLASLTNVEQEFDQLAFNGEADEEMESRQEDWDELVNEFYLLDEYFQTL
jgi:hypothetical protein